MICRDIIEKEMIPELTDSVAELKEMIQFSNSLKHFTPKTNRKIVSTPFADILPITQIQALMIS